MFRKARIKLTLWYLLIITLICVLFSVVAYQGLIFELSRSLRRQALRTVQDRIGENAQPYDFPGGFFFHLQLPRLETLDAKIFEEARKRVLLQLLFANAGILIISGFAAYFLSGKTLKPIEEMVLEQKRFVADASHEIRTPLTAMKTEIEVALKDKKIAFKQTRNLLNSNLEEVNKIQSLTDYLLTLSKYENADIKLATETVSLQEIVNKVVAKIKSMADAKKISLITEVKNIKIQVNSISLIELITILLDNAIKYSPKGSSIIVKGKSDHTMITISVADFGIGIDKKDIPYIFNRFYRADSSRSKTNTHGYGLGLSIAKSIVELHKGKIYVESEVGKGSIFTVELPVQQF